VGTPGIAQTGTIDFRFCESQLVTLDMQPLIHPLAGCVDSEVWFAARADHTAPNADGQNLPYGGCDFFYERDLVEEFLAGRAQLFRSEASALSWNLITYLTATSCDETTPDADGMDHRGELPELGEIGGSEVALRLDPQCFDANRPFTPGRCSYATPQLCKNVKLYLAAAPPLDASGGLGDDDGDGAVADGDGSGVEGDHPCRTGELFGCDDNCVDLPNLSQVNSNGGSGGDPWGNLCDPDLDGDGDVDDQDAALQLECFMDPSTASIDCAEADLVGGSITSGPDPNHVQVDGYDRLQQLRWRRDPNAVPGEAPAL
jgi:hypothetical protein